MRRREFIAGLGGAAAAWPIAAHPQQSDRVRSLSLEILSLKAETAAARIRQFFKEIESQVGWTTQVLLWSAGTLEQRRFDALVLLRQVPAITELAQLDSTGIEQVRVARGPMDLSANKSDYSQDAKFTAAIAKKVYYGPVYSRQSDPHMSLSVAGARRDFGVSIVEVNLKLIRDLVMQMKVGAHSFAYIVDAVGHVVVHPDIGFRAIFQV